MIELAEQRKPLQSFDVQIHTPDHRIGDGPACARPPRPPFSRTGRYATAETMRRALFSLCWTILAWPPAPS